MKICIISHAIPPEKLGGAESYVNKLALGLHSRGHEVLIITQGLFSGRDSIFPRVSLENGLKIYRFYPPNIFSIYQTLQKNLVEKGLWRIVDFISPLPAFTIKTILKKEKPDLIHLQIIHGFSPFFLFRILKKLSLPVVMTLHTYGLFCLRCDLGCSSCAVRDHLPVWCRAFAGLAGTIIDRIPGMVISPSRFCLEKHLKNGIFQKCPIRILPNPVGEEFENPEPGAKPEDCFNIVYSGRLTKNKGVQILIKAVKKINNQKIKVHIAGDGPYKKELEKLAKDDSRIIFYGQIAPAQLKILYQEARVTVVPSLYHETFGNVIVESFARATPVIGSRIGAIPEIIEPGYNGYLFTAGDVDQLKDRLETLMDEPKTCQDLAGNARLSSRKFMSAEHLKKIEEIYAAAINN